MDTPHFYAVPGEPGFGWSVAETGGDSVRVVSGPYTTLDEAHAEAMAMNEARRERYPSAGVLTDPAETRRRYGVADEPATGDFERKIVATFEAVAGAVQSLALQADRYDHEIAELRRLVLERTGQGSGLDPARLEAVETTLRAMSERLDALEALLADDGARHSARVEP